MTRRQVHGGWHALGLFMAALVVLKVSASGLRETVAAVVGLAGLVVIIVVLVVVCVRFVRWAFREIRVELARQREQMATHR